MRGDPCSLSKRHARRSVAVNDARLEAVRTAIGARPRRGNRRVSACIHALARVCRACRFVGCLRHSKYRSKSRKFACVTGARIRKKSACIIDAPFYIYAAH
jgi:hypothetical protein